MKQTLIFLFLAAQTLLFSQSQSLITGNKQLVLQSVETHKKELIALSDSVWGYAETALKEYKSSKAIADYAESQGFKVERGISGMPTAFIASYGSGKPIIGILGEYDALPGLSQKAVPYKEELQAGAAGHGCGHNMFSPGSLGAAIAIKELIEKGKLKGTIRFYGTPAEEDIGGKTYMARDGLFNDLDACLDWHPADETEASTQSTQAMVSFYFDFKGKAAHAAYDPWNGRSAVDGLEFCTNGINYLREHVKPSVRMHYVIKDGGDVPNVVSDHARLWLWVRDSNRKGVDVAMLRVEEIAKGAAMMAGVEVEMKLQAGSYEQLVNRRGAEALQKNLELLGEIKYTEDEIAYAKKIQAATGIEQTGIDARIKPLEPTRPDPEGGSSDVADVSWNVPQISLIVTTAPTKTPWHSWPVVACGGMSIGHKGMLYSARALGMTMVDLFENQPLRNEMRKEFLEKKGNAVYSAMLPAGPPPVPAGSGQ